MHEEALFAAALEKSSAAERRAFLDAACGGDHQLRARVEQLLAADERSRGILDPGQDRTAEADAPAEPPTGSWSGAPDAGAGAVVGPYKLVEVIGEGGMGTVWLAQQAEPVKRLVALKVIKAGMDSRQVVARFEAERQALALMDHPNIARVLDAGVTPDGRPYFVMELVRGVPVTRFCDERRLAPRERLELFVPVCQAVQHAHQKGVIHRDIKPSNVLVALYDGRPVPKVIDFGVAKAAGQPLTEKTLVTGLGAVVGTPEYMSPEQAQLNQLDIDTRSDVYSLGVLLYELLTGTTPLQRKRVREAALLEVLRLVREEEPPRPSTRLSTTEELPSIAANRGLEPRKLSGLIRGELDWIVMRALEKDRSRRYESANGFAADVQRYLAGEAVQAVPPSAGYRLRKVLRRNKGPVLAASVVALALVVGIVGTTWGMVRATDEAAEKDKARAEALQDRDRKAAAEKQAKQDRDDAVAQKNRAVYQQYLLGMYPLSRFWREGGHLQVRRSLDALRPGPGEPDLRGWEWHYQDRLARSPLRTITAHHVEGVFGRAQAVAFSPDGRWLASGGGGTATFGGEQGELFLWDAATGREVRRFHDGKLEMAMLVRVAFSPDGKTLASSDWLNAVRLWDVASGRLLHTLESDRSTVEWHGLSFSPDGRRVVLGTVSSPHRRGGEEHPLAAVNVWDVADGRQLGSWKTGAVSLIAFHPEGQLLAVTPSAATLHEPATGKVLRSLPLGAAPPTPSREGNDDETEAAAVSPDGGRLAVAAEDGIQLWDLTRGLKGRLLKEHARKDTNGLVFSPDGLRLASAGKDGAVEVWDLRETTPRRSTVRILEEGVACVAFSPDGLRLAAAGGDGAVRILDAAATGQESRLLPGLRLSPGLAGNRGSRHAAFTPDGAQFLVLPSNSDVQPGMPSLCDAVSGHKLPGPPGGSGPVAYSPDGRWLASGCKEGIRLWDAATCREVRTIQTRQRCTGLMFLADGRLASVVGASVQKGTGPTWVATVQIWDVASGRELLNFKDLAPGGGGRVAVAPGGKRLAVIDRVPTQPGQPNVKPQPPKLNVWDLEKSRTADESPLFTFQPHSLTLTALAYSPDGRLLATTGWDQDKSWAVKLWDAEGKEVRSIPWPKDPSVGGPGAVVFSPDGRFLAAGSSHVKVWEVTGREVSTFPRKETGPVTDLAFSADGTALAAGDSNGASIWRLTPGREPLTVKVSPLSGGAVAFSPDGRSLATSGKVLQVWDAASGAELHSPGGHAGQVTGMALSPDGRRLATGGKDRTVRLWETGSWKPLGVFEGHTDAVWAVAFSPDGRLLASGDGLQNPAKNSKSAAGDVRIWDLTDRRVGGANPPLHRLQGHPKRVIALAFSPDGQRLVSVGEEGSVKVWDAAGGRELSSGKVALERVGGAAFSPDGRLLACGGDNAVRLWDVSAGREVRVLTVDDRMRRGRETTTILAVTFSPDGRRLAAAGVGMIRVWDTETFQELYTIAPAAPTGGLAFSPDSGRLVGVGYPVMVSRGSTPTGMSMGVIGIGDEHRAVFYDGRPLIPEREMEREALGLLDQLFSRPLPRKDVLDHLRADPAVPEPVRQEALRLAVHYREEEDPKRYADAARALARSAHLPSAWHRQALSQAEAAGARAPEEGSCLTALGMAQYRLGQFADALKTLTRADRLNARQPGGSIPADLALLALVHHRLGHKDEVGKLMDRLRQRVQDGRWKHDEEAGVLLREAELSIHGKLPPWPAEHGPQSAPAELPKR